MTGDAVVVDVVGVVAVVGVGVAVVIGVVPGVVVLEVAGICHCTVYMPIQGMYIWQIRPPAPLIRNFIVLN